MTDALLNVLHLNVFVPYTTSNPMFALFEQSTINKLDFESCLNVYFNPNIICDFVGSEY